MTEKLNQGNAVLMSAPVTQARAVTPNDSTDLPNGVCRALYIGTAGNVAVILEGDTAAVTHYNCYSGQVLPVRASRVLSTVAATAASNIVAWY